MITGKRLIRPILWFCIVDRCCVYGGEMGAVRVAMGANLWTWSRQGCGESWWVGRTLWPVDGRRQTGFLEPLRRSVHVFDCISLTRIIHSYAELQKVCLPLF